MPAKHAKRREMRTTKKPASQMTAAELEALTADLDEEFVLRKFGPPPPEALAQWERTKRKRRRPLSHG